MASIENERRQSSLNANIPEKVDLGKRPSLRSVDLDSVEDTLNIKVTSFDISNDHSTHPADQSALEEEQHYLNWVDSKSGRHLSSPSTGTGKRKQSELEHSSKEGNLTTESLSIVATPPPYPSGSDPVKVVCPKCGEYVETVVLQMPSAKAIMICSILMLLLLWCFCWIPLCMKRYIP
ncbi:uncharacterized protein LOC142340322 [Convolutriloba macropyga]|uniref:uncharacterized protein LOC142340322 n=1 Tax=Convolutriloba macropyga TaxID=536237 RepID=UPI003F521262